MNQKSFADQISLDKRSRHLITENQFGQLVLNMQCQFYYFWLVTLFMQLLCNKYTTYNKVCTVWTYKSHTMEPSFCYCLRIWSSQLESHNYYVYHINGLNSSICVYIEDRGIQYTCKESYIFFFECDHVLWSKYNKRI